VKNSLNSVPNYTSGNKKISLDVSELKTWCCRAGGRDRQPRNWLHYACFKLQFSAFQEH